MLIGLNGKRILHWPANFRRGRFRTSVVSRMKFFVTNVSSWESLTVVTKKSVLVPKGVLDLALLEVISMELYQIFYKYFVNRFY